MKSILRILSLGILAAGLMAASTGLMAPPAGAAPLFLSDWGISYGNWAANGNAPTHLHSVVEDWVSGGNGYLDPGYGGDAYDVEAAYLGWDDDYLYLAVVTGFPLAGRQHGAEFYEAGDLALDVTGDSDYDFAVDVSSSGALRSGSLNWENPAINGGQAWGGISDPLRVTSWTNTDAVAGFSYGAFSGRYAIETMIDRSLIGSVDSYTLHWTMGCGNDAADLHVNPVPEPATLLLLGGGLALAGTLRRLRKRS